MNDLMTREEMLERYWNNMFFLKIELNKEVIDTEECNDIMRENYILSKHLKKGTFYNMREGK